MAYPAARLYRRCRKYSTGAEAEFQSPHRPESLPDLSVGTDAVDEAGHVFQGRFGCLQVRGMSAVLKEQRGGFARRSGGDGLYLGRGAVLVVPPLDDQQRRLDRGQEIFDVPGGEPAAQPGPRPGLEQILGLVAVVAGETGQPALGEGLGGLADGGDGDRLDKDVGRLGDDAQEAGRLPGGKDQADAAAVGMTDQQERSIRKQGIDDPGQLVQPVLVEIMDGESPFERGRPAVAEPVVDQPRTAGACAELPREILPLADGTQSFVQKDQAGPVRQPIDQLIVDMMPGIQFKKRHGQVAGGNLRE